MVPKAILILQVLLFHRVFSDTITSIEIQDYTETNDDNYSDDQKIKVTIGDSEKLYNIYHSDKDGKDTNNYKGGELMKEKDLRIIIVYEDSSKTGKEIKLPKTSEGSSTATVGDQEYTLEVTGNSLKVTGNIIDDVNDNTKISFKKNKFSSNVYYMGVFTSDDVYLQSIAFVIKNGKVNSNPFVISSEASQSYAQKIEQKEMIASADIAKISGDTLTLNLPLVGNSSITLNKDGNLYKSNDNVYVKVDIKTDKTMVFIFRDPISGGKAPQAPSYLGKLDQSIIGGSESVNQLKVVSTDDTISMEAGQILLLI